MLPAATRTSPARTDPLAPRRAATRPPGIAPARTPSPYAATSAPTPPLERWYVSSKWGRSGVSAVYRAVSTTTTTQTKGSNRRIVRGYRRCAGGCRAPSPAAAAQSTDSPRPRDRLPHVAAQLAAVRPRDRGRPGGRDPAVPRSLRLGPRRAVLPLGCRTTRARLCRLPASRGLGGLGGPRPVRRLARRPAAQLRRADDGLGRSRRADGA